MIMLEYKWKYSNGNEMSIAYRVSKWETTIIFNVKFGNVCKIMYANDTAENRDNTKQTYSGEEKREERKETLGKINI